MSSTDLLGLALSSMNTTAQPVDVSRIAIVVPNADRREILQKELDPTGERFRVIAANQIIAGMRFNAVIVPEEVSRIAFLKGRTARDRFDGWLADVQRHCVNNSKIVRL